MTFTSTTGSAPNPLTHHGDLLASSLHSISHFDVQTLLKTLPTLRQPLSTSPDHSFCLLGNSWSLAQGWAPRGPSRFPPGSTSPLS